MSRTSYSCISQVIITHTHKALLRATCIEYQPHTHIQLLTSDRSNQENDVNSVKEFECEAHNDLIRYCPQEQLTNINTISCDNVFLKVKLSLPNIHFRLRECSLELTTVRDYSTK